MKWCLVLLAAFAVCQGQIVKVAKVAAAGNGTDGGDRPRPGNGTAGEGPRNFTKPAFMCYDGTFLQEDQVCDGVEDCSKGYMFTTEDEEPRRCAGPDKFICFDWEQTVIDIEQRCDGHNDCPVYWGEVSDDESAYECATEDEFACDMETVIPIEKKCDGVNDCELYWGTKSADENAYECKEDDEWICWDMDQTIIKEDQLCDGNPDCPPDEWRTVTADEDAYQCAGPDDFVCWGGEKFIPNDQKCDGTPQCPTSEWEEVASDENMYECARPDQFVCSASVAIPQDQRCDGNNDCDGEDEDQWLCDMVRNGTYHYYPMYGASGSGSGEEMYQCHDGTDTWIPHSSLCDGVRDCMGRDEYDWECQGPMVYYKREQNKQMARREVLKRSALSRK